MTRDFTAEARRLRPRALDNSRSARRRRRSLRIAFPDDPPSPDRRRQRRLADRGERARRPSAPRPARREEGRARRRRRARRRHLRHARGRRPLRRSASPSGASSTRVGEEVARAGALHPGRDALHHAAATRHGEELDRLPRPLRRADPHSCRRRVLARQRSAGSARPRTLYGVPPEIVVGIVGVESIYGRQMGDFRVIDALATLAFDFPSGRSDRSAFFKDELEAWFVLCKKRRHRSACLARQLRRRARHGAVHAVELQQYAVDFDGDGHVDLHANAADVIGSVANYLAEFGWKRGLPARFDVSRRPRRATRASCSRPTSCRPSAPRDGRARRLLPEAGLAVRQPARARRAAERRRGAELRRRHEQLLRADALQLVELLRDGGARARRGGAAGGLR